MGLVYLPKNYLQSFEKQAQERFCIVVCLLNGNRMQIVALIMHICNIIVHFIYNQPSWFRFVMKYSGQRLLRAILTTQLCGIWPLQSIFRYHSAITVEHLEYKQYQICEFPQAYKEIKNPIKNFSFYDRQSKQNFLQNTQFQKGTYRVQAY